MKLIKSTIFMTLVIALGTACSSTKTSTYWANSMKVDCDAGSGNTQCLQIYKGDQLDYTAWSNFHAPIEGFNFEPGYLQKIKVSEIPKNQVNLPADVSSIDYKLIKVLDKIQDGRMAIHDIWALTDINEQPISNVENTPSLEVNITEMKVYGTDGCNNYAGAIKNITSENIEFGTLASTRKMCANMEVPGKYTQALNNVRSFKRENLNLHLFDSNGTKILTFKKVD